MRNGAIKRLLTPFEEFARSESAGGVTLIVAALLAFLWANSPWAPGYFALQQTYFGFDLGGWSLEKPLLLWVNDGLMAEYQERQDARLEGRPDPVDPVEHATRWMERNDLRGYVLLGDPAARLCLRSAGG